MTDTSVAYLGPAGTYTEMAALAFAPSPTQLVPYPTFAATLQAAASGEVDWAVVAVENSVEGGVSTTLDTLWNLGGVYIHEARELPIRHALLSYARSLEAVEVVYAHPQALAQCQQWLRQNLPQASLVPSASNTSELQRLPAESKAAAIASERAAQLARVPILARSIVDYDSNCTRFWVVGRSPAPGGGYSSLALCVKANVPGSLLEPLQVFAAHDLNMTRIESRPTKRAIGDYVFFIDLEHRDRPVLDPAVLAELEEIVAVLKFFGSYPLYPATDNPG